LLISAAAVIYIYIFDPKLDTIWDNWIYYILGESLIQGRGYTGLNRSSHTHFPPGYPSLIAMGMFVSRSIIFIKVINGIIFLATIPVLFSILEKMEIKKQLSVINLVTKMDLTGNPLNNRLFLLMLFCLIFSFYIRTLGISLIGAVLIYLAVHKKWKYLLLTIIACALTFTLWIIHRMNNGEHSYIKYILCKDPKSPDPATWGYQISSSGCLQTCAISSAPKLPIRFYHFCITSFMALFTSGGY